MQERKTVYFEKVKKKAERVIVKQLEILEDGKTTEKETAIRAMIAVSEMLKVILPWSAL